MEQTPEEILEDLKKQRQGKTAATVTAGWLSIASIICLGAGVVAGNKLAAIASLCWLSSSVMTSIAAKETQEREEIERRIEFVNRASAMKQAVEEASKSAKAQVMSSLANRPKFRNQIGLN